MKLSPLMGLLYEPQMRDEGGAFGGMRIGRGSRVTLKKSFPSVTFSTTNPTFFDLGSNLVCHDEKLVTDNLSNGMTTKLC
jgi:hypothetical protein